ncbi:unnamed protein product [Soboliphyme baturini]|uniref:RING-type domain-containing protein n=1 Tax=Soboliphyme baturini TaxID=241478 RepID=A0A183IQJ9_9BILA|nr:unnamed protein product [Soboliphyme baturini]
MKAGEDCLKMFDAFKKELRVARSFNVAILNHMNAKDELRMAIERMRIADKDTVKNEKDMCSLVFAENLDSTLEMFSLQHQACEALLRQKQGRLKYITSLRNIDIDAKAGNPDDCPICQRRLGKKWVILPCGHSFCCDCVTSLMLSMQVCGEHGLWFRCPVCRSNTSRKYMTYVCSSRGSELLDSVTSTSSDVTSPFHIDPNLSRNLRLFGDFSSKIMAVVRLLAYIKAVDSTTKCLVFSTWKDILQIASFALVENNIPFFMVENRTHLRTVLPKFKADCHFSVLLMPTSIGANGLNITEAKHVIFIEPVFDPHVQQQAAGRVHRIGQTDRTYVHHLILRGSIEEKISSSLNRCELQDSDQDHDMPFTMQDLANLFLL